MTSANLTATGSQPAAQPKQASPLLDRRLRLSKPKREVQLQAYFSGAFKVIDTAIALVSMADEDNAVAQLVAEFVDYAILAGFKPAYVFDEHFTFPSKDAARTLVRKLVMAEIATREVRA